MLNLEKLRLKLVDEVEQSQHGLKPETNAAGEGEGEGGRQVNASQQEKKKRFGRNDGGEVTESVRSEI